MSNIPDQIILENIRVFAYHGCLSEETKIGSAYRVDLIVDADLSKSAISDKLEDTVDYVRLNKVVKEEMTKPSKLLEDVCRRINDRILAEHVIINRIETKVSKLNPPIIGDVEAVCVKMIKQR